jgi:hypothetical protein
MQWTTVRTVEELREARRNRAHGIIMVEGELASMCSTPFLNTTNSKSYRALWEREYGSNPYGSSGEKATKGGSLLHQTLQRYMPRYRHLIAGLIGVDSIPFTRR